MKPTHLGAGGEPRMVDVGDKAETRRRAVAAATVRMTPEVLGTLLDAGGPKGDAILTARLAGIAAAKRAPDLIPLAHPLPLDHVDVAVSPDPATGSVAITAEVATTARTGVEVEALTAAAVAALTLYDMAKALQRDIVIEQVRLVRKQGGRSGTWIAPGPGSEAASGQASAADARATVHEAAVVTCSMRSAAGERPDRTGPQLVAMLGESGWDVEPQAVVTPDDVDQIATILERLSERGHRLILTTGGTGLTPTDVTPAATRRVIDREIPGMAELMRSAGLASTPMASLSRGIAGARGQTLIINLPGSPTGALESLGAILPVLRHAVDQLAGGDH